MQEKALKPRDYDAIVELYLHRFLTGKLIKELPLKSGDFPSQQVTDRRLRAMIGRKLVKPFYAGLDERIFRVTKKGLYIVADRMEVGIEDLPWTKHTNQPKDVYFINHFLLTNRFRIGLARACRESEISLVGFIPEYYGKKHASGRITKYVKDSVRDVVFGIQAIEEKISHAPDGVFALNHQGRDALFFLEIDRGTESQSNPNKGMFKFIRYYLGYMEEQRFKTFDETFHTSFERLPRVLITLRSEKRLHNLRSKMKELLPSKFDRAKRFFWLTVFNEKTQITNAHEWFWGPIWYSLDAEDDTLKSLG